MANVTNEITIENLWDVLNEVRDDVEDCLAKIEKLEERLDSLESRIEDVESELSLDRCDLEDQINY